MLALSALLLGFVGIASKALVTDVQASANPTFSSVAAVPNSGTIHAGHTLEVYFSEANGATDLTMGACSVNGVAMSELLNLTGGLYKVNYLIATGDTERAAGTVPLNCTFHNSGGGTTTVTAFTDGNTVAIDTNDNGSIDLPPSGPFSFSSVATVPNSGLLTSGQNLEIYLQEASGRNDLTVGGACKINNIDISQFDNFGSGLYRIMHAIGSGDVDRAPGTVPFSCVFSGGTTSTTVDTLTASSTVGIDVNGNGTIDASGGSSGISFSSVAPVPNSGTLHAGQNLEVYFQESTGNTSLSLAGACTVNNVSMSTLQNLTDGLYKVVYTIGSSDTDRAAGTVPLSCMFQNSAGATSTVASFSSSNTVAIDVAGDGIGTNGTSTDNGTIDGDVQGGSSTSNGTLDVTGIAQLKSVATANGSFEDGWVWVFDVTVPTNETHLQMKFADWTHSNGSSTIPVANNIRISSQQATATSTITIGAANTYSTPALIINGDTNSSQPGRQIQVKVEARVPSGTLNGSYGTTWGVLTTE